MKSLTNRSAQQLVDSWQKYSQFSSNPVNVDFHFWMENDKLLLHLQH